MAPGSAQALDALEELLARAAVRDTSQRPLFRIRDGSESRRKPVFWDFNFDDLQIDPRLEQERATVLCRASFYALPPDSGLTEADDEDAPSEEVTLVFEMEGQGWKLLRSEGLMRSLLTAVEWIERRNNGEGDPD